MQYLGYYDDKKGASRTTMHKTEPMPAAHLTVKGLAEVWVNHQAHFFHSD